MELETWQAPSGERIPNHPSFPVLLYRDVEAAAGGADACSAQFSEHGWGGSWVDGVFGFHHFHSTSHEVLAVIGGRATLELGGPQGRAFEVSTGDVVVLPAGTGRVRRITTSCAGMIPKRLRPHASGSRRSGPRRKIRSAARASGGGADRRDARVPVGCRDGCALGFTQRGSGRGMSPGAANPNLCAPM
jgi:uncharacterized protein YjlB